MFAATAICLMWCSLSAMSSLPCPARALRRDVVPSLIETIAHADAFPWPILSGGNAHGVASAARRDGEGQLAAVRGADDLEELLLGVGELHGENLTSGRAWRRGAACR